MVIPTYITQDVIINLYAKPIRSCGQVVMPVACSSSFRSLHKATFDSPTLYFIVLHQILPYIGDFVD